MPSDPDINILRSIYVQTYPHEHHSCAEEYYKMKAHRYRYKIYTLTHTFIALTISHMQCQLKIYFIYEIENILL